MITDSNFGFPAPRMSGRELKRARLIYHGAKWSARSVLIALVMLASVGVESAAKEFDVAIPEWVMNLSLGGLVGFSLPFGGAFGLRVLRAKGLEAAFEERRVIERTRPEPPAVRAAEPEETRLSQRELERLVSVVFLLMWAFFFAALQLSGIGFESADTALIHAFVAAVPAIALALCLSYSMQDPRLRGATQGGTLDYQKFLAVVPWSRVARVKEVRSWNFTNSLAECQLIFQDVSGREIQQVTVPPYAAAEVFAHIQTRLTGQTTGAAS